MTTNALDSLKDHLNQQVLSVLPESWHESVMQVLPHYWQEWTLLLMGGPFLCIFLIEWLFHIQKTKKLKTTTAVDNQVDEVPIQAASNEVKSSSFTLKRAITNFSLGGSYIGFEVIVQALFVMPICLWLYKFRFFDIEVNWLTALPIFMAVEFFYYWFHRTSHRVTWFWSAHVVHHSDDGMNLSTALRQSMLYSVVGWWLFFTPIMLLGVHPVWVFFFYAMDLIYQYFVHTENVDKLPRWYEYIFNTPSHHRAHHATNPEYIDKNYGGVVIIFDRMFGTFVDEDPINNPVKYGAVGEKTTYNVLTIVFGVFARMWQEVLKTKGLINKLIVMLRPPE